MKLICLFAAGALFILGSATPPASSHGTAPGPRPSPLIAKAPPPPIAPTPAPVEAPAMLASAPAPHSEVIHWDELAAPVPAATDPAPARDRDGTAERPGNNGSGPVRVVVSLPQQKAFVYRGGALLWSSKVSTGKRGHSTPTGTFRILQKRVKHHSNLYANAPMPYMQRLTNGGIALHAGHVPGYRASHGCIRLPWANAKKLYGITNHGTTVVVTNDRVA